MGDACLPEEIFYNIVTQLPTKPLLRFQCVSKHWKHVISDFVKRRSRRMILLPVEPTHAIDTTDYSMVEVRFPYGNSEGKGVWDIGTVNGIVLIVELDSPDNILYNPFTGAVKKVSDAQSNPKHNYVYGFGYGTTPGDLKIVKILRSSDKGNPRSCSVFSLKTRSWNTPSVLIGDYKFIEYKGVFANGVLYWMTSGCGTRVILALDVKDMVFSEIQLPCDKVKSWFPLGTLKGCLCMILRCSEDYELWVMNEHDIWKSWSKLSTLTLLLRDNYLKKFITLSSRCMLDEGKLVFLENTNEFIIYDMLTDSYKKVKKTSTTCLELKSIYAIEYVESCVSLSP